MNTIVIQIGNSDDKLSQREWSEFICTVHRLLTARRVIIHFSGGTHAGSPFQNYCWVCDAPEPAQVAAITEALRSLAARHRQDSIALTIGTTQFVTP